MKSPTQLLKYSLIYLYIIYLKKIIINIYENQKKILITGGSGYIGSCLYSKLKKQFSIAIIDKKAPSKFLPKNLKYHKIDLKDKNKLLKLLKNEKPDIIVHLAGQSTIDMVEKKGELIS